MASGAERPVGPLVSAATAGQFYVDLYGAKGDAKTNATVTITAGQNHITTTNSPFTAFDNGKLAWLLGAGPNAQHIVGYLRVVDANHADLVNAPIGGTAVNASTTLLGTGGTAVYGSDDAAPVAAAEAARNANTTNPGTLRFGNASYITSGTLGDTSVLNIEGIGAGQSKVYCTADYFWKNDATNLNKALVRGFSLFLVKHGFADTRSQAQSSGLPMRHWHHLEIGWYTGCAWQNNTADGPTYKLDHITFTGWDELETIAAVFSGQSDSAGISHCQSAGAHRCIYRVTRGPNCEIKDGGLTTGLPFGICNLADGAMTSGSDILTSAVGGFDASHVGLTVTVARASNAGGQNNVGTLNSVIRQVDSVNQVRLNDAATLTTSAAAIGIKAKARPCRVVNDAATTAGTTTITSATANFTQADKGSGVTIRGAGWDTHTGTTSGDLNARIQSVTNSTTVVINVAATATVSGAKLTIAAPQVKVHLEGFTNSTNAGNGFSVNNMKFGSEKILPGDIEFGIMDSDVDLLVTDGAMTSGSTTLTSVTSAFTSDMVKARYVYVVGAGANGSDIYSRIETVIDASNITLNVSAGTTVTGASVTRTKLNGLRMPVHNQVSSTLVIQMSMIDCNFGNAGNGSNGVSLSPYYSTSPNVRGSVFGPNFEYGSAFQWLMEYGPDVTATNDPFNRTNLVYPMLDDNSGHTRLAAAISSIPGMFATQLVDPSHLSSPLVPGFEATAGGGVMGVTHLLKTRATTFSVNANATLIGAALDADTTDAAEYSFTTFGGTVSATILQGDVIIGEPAHIGFGLAAGSSSSVDRVKVIVKYGGGSTIDEWYVPVPQSGYRWIKLKTILPTATGNITLQFATDSAGRFKLARPVMYHSRIPVNFGQRKWLTPNGTDISEGITDAGVLTGVTANPAPTFFQKGLDSARPTASSVASGGVYFGTNSGVLWESDGVSAWTAIAWDRERLKFGTTKTTMRENFPNWAAQTSFVITDQTAYAMATDYLAGDIIATITFGTGGTGWTFGTNNDGYYWAALYDTTGNLLAYSPAVTSPGAWGAGSEKPFAITRNAAGGTISNYAVAATGPIMHVFFASRGTGGAPVTATMRGATLGGTSTANGGSIGWGTRGGTGTSGSLPSQTPPSSLTLAATTGLIYTKGYNP